MIIRITEYKIAIITFIVLALIGGSVYVSSLSNYTLRTLAGEPLNPNSVHEQPEPQPDDQLAALNVGQSGVSAPSRVGKVLGTASKGLGINFYFKPTLVTNNVVLKDDDEVCIGDTVTIEAIELEGEWFGKGGPSDSPPIVWVDNLGEVIAQINNHAYKIDTDWVNICTWLFSDCQGTCRCRVKGNVICEAKCNIGSIDNAKTLTSNSFEITGEGTIKLGAECKPECILFVDRPETDFQRIWRRCLDQGVMGCPAAYGYMTLPLTKSIQNTLTLTPVVKESTSSVEISLKYPESVSDPFTISGTIKNTGESEISLLGVETALPYFEILYAPTDLAPGEEGEVIIEAGIEEDTAPQLKFIFNTKTLGCKSSRIFEETVQLNPIHFVVQYCTNDPDCDEGFTCCNGICKDTSKGTCDDIDGDASLEWVYY